MASARIVSVNVGTAADLVIGGRVLPAPTVRAPA